MAQPAVSTAAMTKDMYSHLSAVETLAPAVRTATASGTGVDLMGYEGALVLVHMGDWTDGSHAFEIQESDDDGDTDAYSAVADADLVGASATPEPTVSDETGDDRIVAIAYIGGARYIRVVQTVTGSPSTGLAGGALVVRGYPRHMNA